MQDIALKIKLDFEKYQELNYQEKLTVQKFLYRESQKLKFRYAHHKLKAPQLDLGSPMLGENFALQR